MQELGFHPSADQEVSAAAGYYETRRVGLGGEFIDELDAGIRRIQQNPFLWRRLRGDLRRYLLRRLPCGVIYHASTERIFVLVVMHLSREPDYWLKRIDDIPEGT